MLTFFTAPKPFKGQIGILQRNAIESWLRLHPSSEVLLFGDEVGIAEVARVLKLQHIPEIGRSEYGTPLISSLFEKAQEVAKYDILCFVNADIIFMSDFLNAVQKVIQWRKGEPFLLVGRRWGVDIDAPWDFEQTEWENRLRALVQKRGTLFNPSYIDYFVFPRGLWKNIPPFAIGRPRWDNWMIYRARSLGVPVLDATTMVMAIHQNHDYAHHLQGADGFWKGPEAERNFELAGGWTHLFTLQDANWIVTPHGPKRQKITMGRLHRYLEISPVLFPRFAPYLNLINMLLSPRSVVGSVKRKLDRFL